MKQLAEFYARYLQRPLVYSCLCLVYYVVFGGTKILMLIVESLGSRARDDAGRTLWRTAQGYSDELTEARHQS